MAILIAFKCAHSMCTKQYAKLVKLLVCKFATTAIFKCGNCWHTRHFNTFYHAGNCSYCNEKSMNIHLGCSLIEYVLSVCVLLECFE